MELAKATEQANHAHQVRRDMKDQLDRTLGEKLLLEEEVERLYSANVRRC